MNVSPSPSHSLLLGARAPGQQRLRLLNSIRLSAKIREPQKIEDLLLIGNLRSPLFSNSLSLVPRDENSGEGITNEHEDGVAVTNRKSRPVEILLVIHCGRFLSILDTSTELDFRVL